MNIAVAPSNTGRQPFTTGPDGNQRLPISVIVPTRNSIALLPGHIETMEKWIDLVEEIIVVDSQSTDGTLELLKERLDKYNTRFFAHPPGLYQSWNFGIQQARAKYVYVSTIGDAITREGLIHLANVASEYSCDVVISPPQFVNESGNPIPHNNWPVHDIISFLDLKHPASFEGVVPFAAAICFLPFAILGSSASNLYRAQLMQQNPFPTEFGMNGDGGWGVSNALKVRFGVTPQCVSFFRKHEKPYSLKEYETSDAERRMINLAVAAFEDAKRLNPAIKAEAERLEMDRFLNRTLAVHNWRAALLRQRELPWPWILNPVAWVARLRRKAAQRECEAFLKTALNSYRKHQKPDADTSAIASKQIPDRNHA